MLNLYNKPQAVALSAEELATVKASLAKLLTYAVAEQSKSIERELNACHDEALFLLTKDAQ